MRGENEYDSSAGPGVGREQAFYQNASWTLVYHYLDFFGPPGRNNSGHGGEGATDTAVFGEYIRRVLLPTLSPEDIVIMDNLRAHHNPKVIELIESCGAHVRFLPPYSPDSNPIEKMWGKIKKSVGQPCSPQSAGTI
ncbi:MAG: hypothetical protein GKR87_05990 [Kiritimatiellae bacterium]|nr:hypothetical protein [Kiritimatiellia bacterium]